MKIRKVLVFVGVILLAVGVLAVCFGGFVIKGEQIFVFIYEIDLDNFNYLIISKAVILNIISNVIDGLFENDCYGNFVFFMVEDWLVFKDGLIYIYKICQDVKWYIFEGEEYVFVKV